MNQISSRDSNTEFNRDRAGGGGNEAGTKSASPEETSHKKEKLMVNDSSCELLADYYCCPVLLLGQENRFGPGPKHFDLAQIILDSIFNLFMTSKNETTNSPIHEFKVLQNVFK